MTSSPPTAPMKLDGPEYIRSSVAHLLDHDNRYGGMHLADAALQVWRAEQQRLDREIESSPGHLSAVSELAQVAGWVCFDADRQDEARAAFRESHALAQAAGDRSRCWFALDMMAMQDVYKKRPGAALRVANEMLSTPTLPPRVALLADVRRARALAQAGERTRSLDLIRKARSGLQDSVTSRDPTWTWWVNDVELIGHQGELLMSLGDHGAALPFLRDARAAVRPGGRSEMYYTVTELSALTRAGAWRECEDLMHRVPPLLAVVASGRSRRLLASTLRDIEREGPGWVGATAHDVADLMTSP